MSAPSTERPAASGPQLPAPIREALSNPILPTNEEERQQMMARIVERVAIIGDLALMQPSDRVLYYDFLCRSLGLNPLTRPFEYIQLSGKLTLYPRRDTTDQLRVKRGVTIDKVERLHDADNDLAIVTTWGHTPDGREDQAQGIVFIGGLKAEGLANAWMKAETKSKRRLTLSLVGLGMLDETEVADTPGAFRVEVDPDDGSVKQLPRADGATQTERVRSVLEQAGETAPDDQRILEGEELDRWLRGCHAAMRTRTQGEVHDELRRVAASTFELGDRSLNDLTLTEWRWLARAIAELPVIQQPGDDGSPSVASTTPPAQDQPAVPAAGEAAPAAGGEADLARVSASPSTEQPEREGLGKGEPAPVSQPEEAGARPSAPVEPEASVPPVAAPPVDPRETSLAALLQAPSAETLLAFAAVELGIDTALGWDDLTEADTAQVVAALADRADYGALFKRLPAIAKANIRRYGHAPNQKRATPRERPTAEQLQTALGGDTTS